jgi:SAM-dependent methyltransferase
MEIKTISPSLNLSSIGLWQSGKNSEISYPKEGNDKCFAIEEKSFWFRHRNDIIRSALELSPPPDGAPLLDMGGGNGFVAKSIQDMGLDIALVEPGVNGALNAKSRGVDHVICSTLENAQILDECIAGVGLFDVLEHIEGDCDFLKLLHRILKENGKLYLTVPAYQCLWSKDDVEAGHFRRYTKKSLHSVLRDSGFEISYSSYFFQFLPLPIFLFRTIPSFLGLTKPIDENKHASEHNPNLGFLQRILNGLLGNELSAIRKAKSLMFGGSIILVAIKQAHTV